MANASDALKSRKDITKEATKDMTVVDRVLDVGSNGSMTNKYLNRQYLNLNGDLQKSQAYVANMTYQTTDDEYQEVLEDIDKNTKNAIGKSDAIFNVMGVGFTALNVASLVGGIKNMANFKEAARIAGNPAGYTIANSIRDLGGTATGKTGAAKILGGFNDALRVSFGTAGKVPGAVVGFGAYKLAGKGAAKAAMTGVSNFIGNMSPFLLSYGLTGAINKGIKNDILSKTEDTMIMLAAVNEGIKDWENDDLHGHFDNMTKGYSDGLHDLSDQLDSGEISEAEYNQKVDELNNKYQEQLTNMVDSLSPEDQTKLQTWLNNTAANGFDLNADDIHDIDMATMYTMYGGANQQIGQNNPSNALSEDGRNPNKYYDEDGILHDVSDECKEANQVIYEAVNKYKYGTAGSEFGAFFKTLNARIVNVCPFVANIEATVLKAVDWVVDNVMDLATDGQHKGAYEGMSISEVADNIRLDNAKHLALIEGYQNMIVNGSDDYSWMPKDYTNINAHNDYLDSIANADSIADINSIVDSGNHGNVLTIDYTDANGITHENATEQSVTAEQQANNNQTEVNQQQNATDNSQSGNDQTTGNEQQTTSDEQATDEHATQQGDYAYGYSY